MNEIGAVLPFPPTANVKVLLASLASPTAARVTVPSPAWTTSENSSTTVLTDEKRSASVPDGLEPTRVARLGMTAVMFTKFPPVSALGK